MQSPHTAASYFPEVENRIGILRRMATASVKRETSPHGSKRSKRNQQPRNEALRSGNFGVLWTILGIAAIGLFCLQAILAMPHLSQTSDETVHLASGYTYWQMRDFRMNPEHPPLVKLIA